MQLDLSGFPLIVTRYLRTPCSEDFVEYEAKLRGDVYARDARFINIADLSQISVADPTVRQEGAAMAERVSMWTQKYCVASIVVIRSPLVRGIMTAVRWISAPASPEYTAPSMSKAAEIAERCFRDEGLELSEETRMALARLRHHD